MELELVRHSRKRSRDPCEMFSNALIGQKDIERKISTKKVNLLVPEHYMVNRRSFY